MHFFPPPHDSQWKWVAWRQRGEEGGCWQSGPCVLLFWLSGWFWLIYVCVFVLRANGPWRAPGGPAWGSEAAATGSPRDTALSHGPSQEVSSPSFTHALPEHQTFPHWLHLRLLPDKKTLLPFDLLLLFLVQSLPLCSPLSPTPVLILLVLGFFFWMESLHSFRCFDCLFPPYTYSSVWPGGCMCFSCWFQGDPKWEGQPDERGEPRHRLRADPHASAWSGRHDSPQRHTPSAAGGGDAHQERGHPVLNPQLYPASKTPNTWRNQRKVFWYKTRLTLSGIFLFFFLWCKDLKPFEGPVVILVQWLHSQWMQY